MLYLHWLQGSARKKSARIVDLHRPDSAEPTQCHAQWLAVTQHLGIRHCLDFLRAVT
jgi:hypothetical protein